MKRPFLIFTAALIVFCGAFVAVFATASDRDFTLRGYVDATSGELLPFRLPRLGVNVDLAQYAPDELPAVLAEMQDAHVVWVRQIVNWATVESEPGVFDWSAWTPIFAALEALPELRILPVLVGSPDWARQPDSADPPLAPPQDTVAFAAFAAAFAEQFGDQIDVYQVWDEPNLADAWGDQDPRPAEYVSLLAAASQVIRAVDPGAQILAAALAPTTETGERNISDILYLEQLYALGAAEYVDGFAAKPYGFSTPPTDRTVDPTVLNFSRVIALREVMTANGDGESPLWISEYGWNALPDGWQGDPSIWGSVAQDEQAAYTLDALRRAEREWTWLGGMILAEWQPNAAPENAKWGFAVYDQHGNPTPLAGALASYTELLSGNGRFPAANPFAAYSGVWTFGELGADIGWIQDSQLEFRFSGRDIALIVRQGNYEAYLYPTIDEIAANAIPTDAAGNAFINLKSDELDTQVVVVPVSRNLVPGEHILRAAADRGWDQWALVGYAVSGGDLTAPYNRQIAIAVFATLITGAAAVVSGFQVNWSPLLQRIRRVWRTLGTVGELVFSGVTSLALVIGMFLTWGDATPTLFRREPVQLGIALLTAGVIYIEPGMLVTFVAAAVLFVVLYHRPLYGLMLTLFYAPFFLFPVELLVFAFPMAEILILFTGAAWALRALAEIERARRAKTLPVIPVIDRLARLHALDWAMLAWAALGTLSLVWADYRDPAITELRALILEPVLFYVILRSLKPSTADLLKLVDTLLFAALIVSVLGLFMFVTGTGAGVITAEGGTERLASVYGSPNNVALFLGRAIPFALAFTLSPLDRRRRIAGAFLTVLLIVTVVLTLSAGAMFIGIPAAVAAVLMLVYGRRAFLPLIGMVGLGGASALIAAQNPRFARLLDFTEGTNFFRLRVWQSALEMIADRPLTGIGLDQFLRLFRGQYMLPDAWQEPNLSHPHNIVLDYWTRLGILGVVLLIFTQIIFWRFAFALYRGVRKLDPMKAALVIGAMGVMINVLAHGLVDNSVFVHDLAYVFTLIMGIIGVMRTSELLTQSAK